jgi:hypothetical protein
MIKRGRKSATELATVVIRADQRRPEPPTDLTEAEAIVWAAIVSSTPGGWFSVAQEPLLSAYCRHVVTGDQLSALINQYKPDLHSLAGLRHYSRLLGMRLRETAAMLSLATRMRLTHQAQMHPRTASRRFESVHPGPKPWERRAPREDG